MSRKEIIFLIVNVPLSILLFYLFTFLLNKASEGKIYFYLRNGYTVIVFFLLNAVCDLIILKLLKSLNAIIILLSVFEVLMLYILFWHWFSNSTF